MASGSYIAQCNFKVLPINMAQLQFLPQFKIANLLEGTRKSRSLGEIHSWINQLWLGPHSTEMAAEGLSVFLSPLFLHQGIIIS